MLKFKEGQTYICVKTKNAWWTEGKEYKIMSDNNGFLTIEDDEGFAWGIEGFTNNEFNTMFKLKEESKTAKFDLNKLTHEELRIYCNLVDAVSDAQYSLDEFISSKLKNM